MNDNGYNLKRDQVASFRLIPLKIFLLFSRLSESYDSFLIGLSREMKCDEYHVQGPTIIAQPSHTQVNRQQPLEPLTKRKCIGNGTAQAVSGPLQSKQLVAIKSKQPSVARLSKSMSRIGTQVSIQKVPATQQSANVTSVGTMGTGTGTVMAPTDHVIKIKKVKSLHQSAVANTSAHSPLNHVNPQQKKTGGINAENGHATGSAKKIHVISTSKIPGRTTKLLIPVTSISAAQVNAQSTPTRSVAAAKPNSIAEDPLKIDDTTTTATPELTIEPIINANNVRPAFVKEVTLHQTNKQLSTSLPPMKSNGIVTRSRNTNPERPKQVYKCDQCEFTTEVQQNLMRHSLAHTADKPRTCHVCKKRFPRKSLLLAHMREYHQELHSDVDYWESYE